MLRACVLDLGSWEDHLPLVEFAHYEALYGRPCQSLVCWTEVGEKPTTGPDLVRDTSKKVDLIR